MKHLDLFSGIGGFALAVDTVWPGSEHIFCDNDTFCQEVLKKHWPKSLIYGDIRALTSYQINLGRDYDKRITTYPRSEKPSRLSDSEWEKISEAWRINILTGGFPCQPFSQAGRRKGTEDDRHLWPEMLRVIREFRPEWVIGENVAGLLTISEGLVFEQVCADLEKEGYEVQPFIIPAVAVNAPHRRDRVWIVAHSISDGHHRPRQGGNSKKLRQEYKVGGDVWYVGSTSKDVANTQREGHEGQEHQEGHSAGHRRGTQSPDWTANWIEVATRLCRVDDGLPRRLDRNPRLKALGNAIVPQVAIEIMKAIKEVTPSPSHT